MDWGISSLWFVISCRAREAEEIIKDAESCQSKSFVELVKQLGTDLVTAVAIDFPQNT